MDRTVARDDVLWHARWQLLGEDGRPPKAGSDFLWAASSEIEALRTEAANLDFGTLNVYDYGGSRQRRAQRYQQFGNAPPREVCEEACRESYVLRGLEGLLRRRGVGLEFLDYVYASATAEPEPRWLPLDPASPDAFEIALPLGGTFDERYAAYPRTFRFGDHATYDEVVDGAVELYQTSDDVGGWDRKRPGPSSVPWRFDEQKSAWWRAMIHVLRTQGRPAHRTSGETNVNDLYKRVRLVAHGRSINPLIDASTFSRWFKKHWYLLVANAPTVDDVAGPAPRSTGRRRHRDPQIRG